MGNSTVYDIRLRYSMEGNANKGLNSLDRNLSRVSKNAGGLGRHFKRLAAGASAYFGFRAGAKHLIGFNANMEQSRIQMSGMLQLAGKMSKETADAGAANLVDTLQQKAKASVGTTQDMVEMASMITRPVMAAGLGMDQLGNFTAQAVVAAKAFGIESGMAARDIESALMGQLRSVDRFSRSLLEPLGYVGDEGRKAFNELGAAARAAKLGEALGGDAIMNMANAQANSFSGVLSTFQDTMQMTLGRAGKPLFAAITEELKSWNKWIDANGEKLDSMAKSFGSGLVSGFKMVKSVIGFMVDHADLLIMVAKSWAAVKLGQKLGGMVQNFGAQVGGGMTRFGVGMVSRDLGLDKVGLGLGKMGIKVGKAASMFGKLIPGIGLAVTAFSGIWSWWKGRESDAEKLRKRQKADADKKVEKFDLSKLDKEGALGGRKAFDRLSQLEFEMGARRGEGPLGARGTRLAVDLQAQRGEMQALMKEAAGIAMDSGIINEKGIPLVNNIDQIRGMVATQMKTMGIAPEFAGTGSDQNKLVVDAIVNLGTNLGKTAKEREANMLKAFKGEFMPSFMGEAFKLLQGPTLDTSTGKKPDFKVTINRIEVQSDDPNRFVVGLTETVRDAVRNRSAAYDTLPEGR